MKWGEESLSSSLCEKYCFSKNWSLDLYSQLHKGGGERKSLNQVLTNHNKNLTKGIGMAVVKLRGIKM